jgi:hypothetical protein
MLSWCLIALTVGAGCDLNRSDSRRDPLADAGAFEVVCASLLNVLSRIILVSGKAVMMGTGTPEAGRTVKVWPIASKTPDRDGRFMRTSGAPIAVLTVGNDGRFGPIATQPNQIYEFEIDATHTLPIRMSRGPFTPFKRSVLLRTLPSSPKLKAVGTPSKSAP